MRKREGCGGLIFSNTRRLSNLFCIYIFFSFFLRGGGGGGGKFIKESDYYTDGLFQILL